MDCIENSTCNLRFRQQVPRHQLIVCLARECQRHDFKVSISGTRVSYHALKQTFSDHLLPVIISRHRCCLIPNSRHGRIRQSQRSLRFRNFISAAELLTVRTMPYGAPCNRTSLWLGFCSVIARKLETEYRVIVKETPVTTDFVVSEVPPLGYW